MNRLFLSFIFFFSIQASLFAQEKQYKVGIVGFYNCENFYDTIDDPKISDEEFTPSSETHYGTAIYTDKVGRLAEVLSQIGVDISPDGLSMFGVAEIENETVLNDLEVTAARARCPVGPVLEKSALTLLASAA